jgi:sulfide:quinone oxidoreductase
MMKIKRLSPRFFVTGQISVSDLGKIARYGFDTIVNNRPDHEVAGQPESDVLAVVAEQLGVEYVHLPVSSGEITQKDVANFHEVSRVLGNRVLLFCQSGARSTILWQLSTNKDPR